MTSRIASMATLLIAAAAIVTFAGPDNGRLGRTSQPGYLTKGEQNLAPIVAPRAESPAYTVTPLPNARGAVLQQHSAVARRLQETVVTQRQRNAYFASLNKPGQEIDGWHAYVERSRPVDGGLLVWTRVSPRVTNNAQSTTTLDYMYEIYFIDRSGNVSLADVILPPQGESCSEIID